MAELDKYTDDELIACLMGEGDQETGGCDHERAPVAGFENVVKIPQNDAVQPGFI